LPARLEQVMNAPALVLRPEIGMIGAPRSTGFGEDEDTLLIVHECVRLANIRTGRPVLDGEADLAILAGFPDDAARAPGHFGNCLRTEMLDDLIERARHR